MKEIYQITITEHAKRQLKKLPQSVIKKLDKEIVSLASTPRPNGCKKLRGSKDRYRVRVGDYRIIYDIFDSELIIIVIEIGNRKEVYK